MNLAVVSLAALAVAILISCTTRLNVGLLCIVFAWYIGVYLGGMGIDTVFAAFPIQLFLTLVGVTLLFSQARVNGTLDRVAHHAVRSCRGNAGLIPIMFFLLGSVLASLGPGNIATAAVLAPMAMAVAGRAGIPAFLMAIMVGNGANSGALSPFAPTGVIVNGLMARIGITGAQWQTYFANLIAHATVAFAGYFAFGGWRLFRQHYAGSRAAAAGGSSSHGNPVTDIPVRSASRNAPEETIEPFERKHWITLAVIGAWIAGVMLFGLNVGMGSLVAVLLLMLLRVGDQADPIRQMPWGVILMVSGVTVLIGLLEKTGGMALFTSLLAHISTRKSVTGTIALVTGLISVYSSTSGVVLPAFLPTVPGLIEKLGGGSALAIATSMNVGAHLVDVSPLSTIGALCIAAAPAGEDSRALFNKLMAWGLSMSLVGAVLCYVFFGLLW